MIHFPLENFAPPAVLLGYAKNTGVKKAQMGLPSSYKFLDKCH